MPPIPLRGFMKQLNVLFKKLSAKVESIRNLCADIFTYVDAEKALAELEEVTEILRDPSAAMNRHTVGFVGAHAEQALVQLAEYERKFLVAECTRAAVRERIENLDRVSDVGMSSISGLYHNWNVARTAGMATAEIRHKYDVLVDKLTLLEDESRRNRIHAVISPEPPKKVVKNHKRSLQDKEMRVKMKGHNPPADQHGFKKPRKQSA